MNRRQENVDNILFNYQTTNRTNFRENNVIPTESTVYKEKPHSTSSGFKKPNLKYIYTMMNWKNVPVSFDVMIDRKQIVRTNPHDTIPALCKNPPDLELDEVRRTRPRLVMTPAVSIDDIDDTKREILLKENYTTHMTREFIDRRNLPTVKSPLREKYASALPTVLRKYKSHYVSPEWRLQSVTWDRHQYRGHCESTKNFWLSR